MGDIADYDSSQYDSEDWYLRPYLSEKPVKINLNDVLDVRTRKVKMNRKTIQTELEAAQAKLGELQKQLDTLSKYPSKDPLSDGQIIQFSKRFPGSAKTYVYVAIRYNGQYYLTDRVSHRMTWEQLVEWTGDTVEHIWVLESSGIDLLAK